MKNRPRIKTKVVDVHYFPALTGLRALAALSVFFAHYYGQWHPGAGISTFAKLVSSGAHGVPIFFTLSGFLITWIYYEAFREGRIRFYDYWLRRFSRLYPLYLVLLLTTLIFGAHRWPDPRQVLANLTLTQSFFDPYRWSGLFQAWSLTVEECFYVTAPIIFLLLVRFTEGAPGKGAHSRKPLSWYPLRLILALTVIACLFWMLGVSIYPSAVQPHHTAPLEFNIFARFAEFGAGMLVAILARWRKPTSKLREWMVVGSWIGFLLTQRYFIEKEQDLSFFQDRAVTLGVCLCIALFIRGTIADSRVSKLVFGNPVVEYLGRISYALYLLQDKFFSDIINGWVAAVAPGLTESWVATYAGFTIIAALVYEAIEKPAQRWLLTALSADREKRRIGAKNRAPLWSAR